MVHFETWIKPVNYAIQSKETGRLGFKGIQDYQLKKVKVDTECIQSNRFYGEIECKLSGLDKIHRVCYKLWFSEEEDKNWQLCLIRDVFAVITNLDSSMTPEKVIYIYCQRRNSENLTKELKDDFRIYSIPINLLFRMLMISDEVDSLEPISFFF